MSTDLIISGDLASAVLTESQHVPDTNEVMFATLDDKAADTAVAPTGVNLCGANEKGKMQTVPWSKLRSDVDFNIRDKSDSYSRESLASLIDNIKQFGMLQPPIVSAEDDGTYLVISGNRRYHAAMHIRDEYQALIDAGRVGYTKEGMPFQRLKVIVHEGLSHNEKLVMMIDHGNRKGLRPYELFRAVVALRKLGGKWNSEKFIQTHLNVERGEVTNHFRITSMPQFVVAAYEAFLKDRKGAEIKLTSPNITKLYAAWNEDKKSGKMAYGGGPAFKAAWDKVVEESKSPNDRKDSAATRVKNLIEGPWGQQHPTLFALLAYLRGDTENIPAVEDTLQNIVDALTDVFPPEPPTTVVEGNVTRAL